jgi:hypothetical protein
VGRRLRVSAGAACAALLALAAPVRAAGASACAAVAPGEDLAARLAGAAPGTRLCLAPGRWPGPLRVGAGVTAAMKRNAPTTSRPSSSCARAGPPISSWLTSRSVA